MLSWVEGETSRIFCFVLDTTGTYRDVVDPEEYQVYIVADEDSVKFVGEQQNGMQRSREVKFSESKQSDPTHVSPDMIKVDRVRSEVSRFIRPWMASLSALFTLMRFAFKALLVGLLGLLVSTLAGKQLSFGRTFCIAVYALVPVVICSLVKVLAMPYPGALLFLVHLVYSLVPVLVHRSEGAAA
jgi:hypothetical protein